MPLSKPMSPCPPGGVVAIMSKRRRVSQPSAVFSTPPPPPATPPPKSRSESNPKARRSLLLTAPCGGGGGGAGEWEPLGVPLSELSLDLTLPTGQTFRWRRTDAAVFTGVVGPHLLSLRHLDGGAAALLHTPTASSSAAVHALKDYLNLGVPLAELWRDFADADPHFAELAKRSGGGARVLRQDPVECVFQFLCSSNNNIGRIEKMVGVLESFGKHLGTVGGLDFYEFPTLERLEMVSEQQLREAGFGYRAKYIVGTVKALQAKPGGGAEWLASLRGLELPEVIDALCGLPGVGPKVAACIALFSLDQHHAIPVDTHVWQIATRYLMPELAGMRLSPKLCSLVSKAFMAKFGKYAGWAQNVFFIGELPSQKLATAGVPKSAKNKRGRNEVVVEVLLESG